MAPASRASASTSAIVGIASGHTAAAPPSGPPGLPTVSTRHAASSASVRSATSPAQSVVRSSVGSWSATGTPSLVSRASTSTTAPQSRKAERKAESVCSPNSGRP